MASLNISTQRNMRLLCSHREEEKEKEPDRHKDYAQWRWLNICAQRTHTHTHIKCKSVGNIHNDKFSLNHSLLATATKLHLQFASDGVACLINGPLPHYGIFCLHLVKERSFSALLAWCLLHYTKYLSCFSTSLVSPLFWHLILPLFFSCASLSL